ncbi:MAG: aldehyde ferredoxin oxidoreductase C-terminal domain-containing protein [Thermodesulfobacteriota bacterium]|nr:aldehyde ferredoxin oxidoreductase C-terminal domain-containing protein [Thermodesulfobacteriota bacterium]
MERSLKKDYSYAGSILRVNLTTGDIRTAPTEKYATRWIGGRAVNTWILLNEVKPYVKWCDPENILTFGVGTLVGTIAPGACRVSVDTKNAFNNGIGSANVGGFWGAELKFAGFDHVVIYGKAEEPVYLWIYNGKVEIRDASSIWGKTTWETEKHIRKELQDERIRVLAIGPAGEKLVRSACIISDRGCAAGGSGCGAVMGSKNLKAIAARGTIGIEVYEPERFMIAVDTEMEKVNHFPSIKEIREKGNYGARGGTLDSPAWEQGLRPVRNGQDDYWGKDNIAMVAGDSIKKYQNGTVSCFSCPISCKPWMNIEEGVYRIEGEGWWNNSVNSYCTKFDNTNIQAAIYAHQLTNQLGLDGDNAAQVISWAFECYEKGLITKEDTDGLELVWGNYGAIIEMIKKLAYREGFGDFLADGALSAAEKLGHDSMKFVIHVKGQDSLDGVRINKGWGFGVVLSPVGGRHLRGGLPGLLNWSGMGRSKPINSYEGVPEELYQNQKLKAVQDILGLCSYIYGQTIDDWVALFLSATGKKLSMDDLLNIGLQAHNLEKAFNTIHGCFDRRNDYPCYRYYNEPVQSGPYKGERIDHETWDRMLDTYYKLQEWDIESSWQTREGLGKIGLEDVAELLEKEGRLK